VIAFVSKNEADYRTLREVAGPVSQSVVSCADVQQARTAIRLHAPTIVVCEVRENGNWQQLLEEAQAAQCLTHLLHSATQSGHNLLITRGGGLLGVKT
jgi:hypothetical protein